MIKNDKAGHKREFLYYGSVDMPAMIISARSKEEILNKYPRLLVMDGYETIENYDPRVPPLSSDVDTVELNLSRLKEVRKSFMYRYDIDEEPRDGLAIQYGSARNMESFLCGLKDRHGRDRYFQIWSTSPSKIRRSFPDVVIIPPHYGLVPPDDPSWGARHFVVDFPEPIRKILVDDGV